MNPVPGSEEAMLGRQKLRYECDELGMEFSDVVDILFSYVAHKRCVALPDIHVNISERLFEASIRTLFRKRLLKHVGDEYIAPTWRGWLCYGGYKHLFDLPKYQE